MYVNFYYRGGGTIQSRRGGGGPWPPPAPPPGDAHEAMGLMWRSHGLIYIFTCVMYLILKRLNSWGWRSLTSRELWKDLNCLNSSNECVDGII